MSRARVVNLRELYQASNLSDRLLDAYQEGYARGRVHWYWRGVLRGAMIALGLELLHFATLWWLGL
jgi:hypothetical protein